MRGAVSGCARALQQQTRESSWLSGDERGWGGASVRSGAQPERPTERPVE